MRKERKGESWLSHLPQARGSNSKEREMGMEENKRKGKTDG